MPEAKTFGGGVCLWQIESIDHDYTVGSTNDIVVLTQDTYNADALISTVAGVTAQNENLICIATVITDDNEDGWTLAIDGTPITDIVNHRTVIIANAVTLKTIVGVAHNVPAGPITVTLTMNVTNPTKLYAACLKVDGSWC
jgi:hypothetical protein